MKMKTSSSSVKIKTFCVCVLLWSAVLFFGSVQFRMARANHLNGAACRTKDSLDFSIGVLKKAVGIYDDNPLYWSNLGVLYARREVTAEFDDIVNGELDLKASLDSAGKYIEKAVEMSEWETVFNINLCLLDYLSGKTGDALQAIMPYARRQDAWPSVLCLTGIIDERMGNDSSAVENYVRALSLSPSLLGSRFYLDLKKRNPRMAGEVVDKTRKRLFSLNDGDPLISARLGCFLWMAGSTDEAEDYLKKSLEVLPAMNRPWLYLGQIAESRKDSLTAVSYYRKAAELDSEDLIPVVLLSRFDKESKLKSELMKTNAKSGYSFELRGHYRTASLPDPFVVSGFEKYFTFIPIIQE